MRPLALSEPKTQAWRLNRKNAKKPINSASRKCTKRAFGLPMPVPAAFEIDSDIRQTIEAPLPGNVRIPFEDLRVMFHTAARQVNEELLRKTAA